MSLVGQRVRVEHSNHGPVAPPTFGTVVRVTSGGMLWVRLDKRVRGMCHPFPKGDDRANNVLTDDDWCTPRELWTHASRVALALTLFHQGRARKAGARGNV